MTKHTRATCDVRRATCGRANVLCGRANVPCGRADVPRTDVRVHIEFERGIHGAEAV